MPGVHALFTGERIYLGTLAGTVPAPLASFAGTYHPKGPPRRYTVGWGRASPSDRSVRVPWGAVAIADRPGQVMPWAVGTSTDGVVQAPWRASSSADQTGLAMPWGTAKSRSGTARVSWGSTIAADRPGRVIVWRYSGAYDAVVATPWNGSAGRDPAPVAMVWGHGLATDVCVVIPWGGTLVCDGCVPIPWGPTTLRDRAAPNWPIVWPIEPDPLYSIPKRGIYIVGYSVAVVTLPDRLELDCGPITINLDLDLWAITLQTTILNRSGFDRIKPQGAADVMIEVTVQGYVMEFLVDTAALGEAFNADNYPVSATSASIRQAAPYIRPRDLSAGSLATAQQHALDELPLSGWTLSWDAVDWPVAAGAWSYQGLTPVQAISRLAYGAGGALQSDLVGQGLRVITRYPVMPWDLPTSIPDYSIPLDTCLRTQRNPTLQGTRPNAVYVHGGESGGILGHVVRAGTAGDIDLGAVINNLITDSIAARALGGKLLAETYQPPELKSVTLPLSDASGDQPMIQLGKIIALTSAPGELLAIAAALKIEIKPPGISKTEGPEITQTVFLHGRQTNPYSRLQSLSPQAPLLVGTILSTTSTTATVQLIGGGTITAVGGGSISQKVYVQGGRIIGAAPALSQVEITL